MKKIIYAIALILLGVSTMNVCAEPAKLNLEAVNQTIADKISAENMLFRTEIFLREQASYIQELKRLCADEDGFLAEQHKIIDNIDIAYLNIGNDRPKSDLKRAVSRLDNLIRQYQVSQDVLKEKCQKLSRDIYISGVEEKAKQIIDEIIPQVADANDIREKVSQSQWKYSYKKLGKTKYSKRLSYEEILSL